MNLSERFSLEELRTINIDFLGLQKTPWAFSRGMKTTRDYNYTTGEIGARVSYSYTYTNGERDVLQPLRKLEFFDKDGSSLLILDITKLLNMKQLRDLNRALRQGRIDYMDAAAADLPNFAAFVPEPYATDFMKAPDAVEVLHRYYQEEMADYISQGLTSFEDVIEAESNAFILGVLNLSVRPPDGLFSTGLTIKQTILHQLTGSYDL